MFNCPIPIEDEIRVQLPKMTRVKQTFKKDRVKDIGATVRAELAQKNIASRIAPGAKIAIGVGSRGITDIAEVVINLVAELKALKAEPFIFPAMGSHGSATAEGQIRVVTDQGITESSTGVAIKSTLDTAVLGKTSDGTEVHIDRYAFDADGIILVNRIKPHTTFRGRIGSGITKMMVVGMGNIVGATATHNHRVDQFLDVVEEMGTLIMQRTPVLFGLGLIENAYDETVHIEVIPAETLLQREPELQIMATEYMGKLYFDDIDVLVIDRMGKDISGAGIDPNITGRNNRGVEGFHLPRVARIVVLDLTEQTHGNASGLGFVDVIPRALFNKIDFATTYANVITAGFLDGAQIPVMMSTARKAVMLAMQTIPAKKPDEIHVVRIQDTLTLDEIEVSTPMLNEVSKNTNMEIIGESSDWSFSDAS